MKVIQPNCRVQFTTEDVDFVVSILGGKTGAAACVVSCSPTPRPATSF